MKFIYLTVICVSMALWSGCATPPQPEATTIQGTWKGQEVRNGDAQSSWLMLSGPDMEFKSADGREWYRGTYTVDEHADPKQLILTITQSSAPEYAGKTCNAIYKLIPGRNGHDTLIISGNEPGNPLVPSSFSDGHARQILFTRD